MDLILSLEHRYDRTPDGAVWTRTIAGYDIFARYLVVFDGVCVVARTRNVPESPPRAVRADGPGVSFAHVPHYHGPWQYLLNRRRVIRAARAALAGNAAVILRVPSPIAGCVEPLLRRARRPYGVEVVGDPWDVFAPGAVKHPLRPLFRWHFARRLRRECAGAAAAAYVTGEALQRRYPPGPGTFSIHYSDVDLPPEAFVACARPARPAGCSLRLIYVGTLDQLYKAPEILIDAIGELVRGGLDLHLIIVGDGKHRRELEARAAGQGLSAVVKFLGHLPGGEVVRSEHDQADLFVLPSRQEGLPRAMIEAMARGLPCIGSTVGGIPELLSPEDLVPPGDVGALAQKIRDVTQDPERMARMSARNLKEAGKYGSDVLRGRRVEFCRHLQEVTRAWLAQTNGAQTE